MTDDLELELEPRTRAYLRSRADVPVPAGLLDLAGEAAAAPPSRRFPRALGGVLAAAAGVVVLAVAAMALLQPPATAPAGAGGTACPVTVPAAAFVPPDDWPATPPAVYGTRWYGTADLWTMLDAGGEQWHSLGPDRGQKTWWWSTHFPGGADESTPAIAVTGRLLEMGTPTLTLAERGTNGSADFGTAMLVGVELPSAGCWEITATYKGQSLSYVVEVE